MKKILPIIVLCLLLFPAITSARENGNDTAENTYFRAKVMAVTDQQMVTLPDGTKTEQQNLRLRGLEGQWQDKEVNFIGIGGPDVIAKNMYGAGDRVLVVASFDSAGNPAFYITDYVRTGSLWWLAIIFFMILLIVGRFKGARSLVALVLTFTVIVKYIIPQILGGSDPVIVAVIGSFTILLLLIYVTEGFCARSHIAVLSIFISLVLTITISWIFILSAKLTGVTSEEIAFLVNIGERIIDFRGLLLAGIIIGALGVLDDVVISQVATVEQITAANNSLSAIEIFRRAYRVGISHIASMTNTLFLAYAGASLPLLVLFVSGQSAFSSFGQIINNEMIATEIIRTLTGSLGLILSVPIATFTATWWYKK